MRGKAHQISPIKGGTLASVVSQSLALESSTTLDPTETSLLDCAWHVVPYEGVTYLALIGYLSVTYASGESALGLNVLACIELPSAPEAGDTALAS